MPRRATTALLTAVLALLLLAAAAPRSASAQDGSFPQLTGRVVDEAEVLQPATEAALIDLLASHEASGGAQVVVVTLSNLQGIAIADYGQRLARAWGLGAESDSPGVLLIVAPNERAVRIEIGPGLEGLTPAVAQTIIEREILPAARAGDFDRALLGGTRAVIAALSGGYIASPPPAESLEESSLARIVVFAIAAFYLAALVYTLVRARRRKAQRAQRRRGGAEPAEVTATAPRRLSRGRRETAGSETSGGEGAGGPDAGGGPGGGSPGGGPSGGGASGGW